MKKEEVLDKKLISFVNFVRQNNLLKNNEKHIFDKIIQLNCNKLNILDFLEQYNSSRDFLIEEAIYIKLLKKYEEGEQLKLCLDIDGRVRCNEERYMGFYISIFGPQSNDLNLGRNDFLKLWKKKLRKEDNYLKNAIFTVACKPIEFRTIFPCFDEPCFKAKFNVKINIEKKILDFNPQIKNNLRVLSNGELIEINEVEKLYFSQNKIFEYKFSESPLMSIYLLTWTIGYYNYLETISNNIIIRAYTLLDRQGDASFALEIAQKSLEFYSNFTNTPYSIHKLDLVPVPNMEFRALECWGCILFLNHALLVNKFLDIKEKINVARTIANEICHMWFGNLTTPEWWDDIWLKEGFARFLEFQCLTQIKPDLNINYKFIELFFQDALIRDESPYTHPVRGICPSTKNLPQIFDTISSAKGASCIRMFYFCISEQEDVRIIVQKFIKKFKFKNITTKDLCKVIEENVDINAIFTWEEWINISGHPALYIYFSEDKKNLIIYQYPFPKNLNLSKYKSIWNIPIFIKTSEYEKLLFLCDRMISINLKEELNLDYERLLISEQFIKINHDMKGFYRVFYTTKERIDDYKNNFGNKIDNEDSENQINENIAIDDLHYIKANSNRNKNELETNLIVIKENDLQRNKNEFYINRKYFFNNVFINTLINNHKKLSVFDIVGIINDHLIINDFSTCLFIIDKIKPVKDYLILFYVNKIYNYFKSQLNKYISFKELLLDQKREFYNLEFDTLGKFPLGEGQEIYNFLDKDYSIIFNLIDKINNNIFSKVISTDKIKDYLVDKIYVNDPLCYLDESKDEFLELGLHYSTCVNKDYDIISYITKNFERGKVRIHKNLKYEVYHIANMNAFQVLKDHEQELSIFNFILNDYINEFYDLSLHGKESFCNSIWDFENTSDKLVTYFILELKKNNNYLNDVYFKNFDFFKRFPTNRKKFLDCYIQIIINEYNEKKSIFIENLSFLNFLKTNHIMKKDIPKVLEDLNDFVLSKVVVNYIYSSFEKMVNIQERKILYNIILQNFKFDGVDRENISSIINLFKHVMNYFEYSKNNFNDKL